MQDQALISALASAGASECKRTECSCLIQLLVACSKCAQVQFARWPADLFHTALTSNRPCSPRDPVAITLQISQLAGVSSDAQASLAKALQDLAAFPDACNMGPAQPLPPGTSGQTRQQDTKAEVVATKKRAHVNAKSILTGTPEQLQHRLEMATSIMRKLHTRKVELEKELALERMRKGAPLVDHSQAERCSGSSCAALSGEPRFLFPCDQHTSSKA